MFCPNCKNEIVPGTSICPTCGANIEQIVQHVTPVASVNQQVTPAVTESVVAAQVEQSVQTQPKVTVSNEGVVSGSYEAPKTPENTVSPVPTPVAQPTPVTSVVEPPQEPMNKSSNNSIKWVIIIILILVVIVGIVFGVSKLFNKPEQNSPTESPISKPIEDVEPQDDTPIKESEDAFLMYIEDVFSIKGRGTVATGRIKRGTISLGDKVQIIGLDRKTVESVITGIEMFRKELDTASAGEDVGLLLRGVLRDDIVRGQAIIKPNSMKSVKKFDADVEVIPTEAGGRHTSFGNNYSPQIYIGTTDSTAVVTLPKGVNEIKPGDKTSLTIELELSLPAEVGTTFSIREGSRTVAEGKITKVY